MGRFSIRAQVRPRKMELVSPSCQQNNATVKQAGCCVHGTTDHSQTVPLHAKGTEPCSAYPTDCDRISSLHARPVVACVSLATNCPVRYEGIEGYEFSHLLYSPSSGSG